MNNKKAVFKFWIVLILLVVGFLLVANILAETSEEERARLESELSDLESQLSAINNGTWVNVSCDVSAVYHENYNLDNKTGYHTVTDCYIRGEDINAY